MTKFQPSSGQRIALGMSSFEFLPHPFFPNDRETVYVMEGAEAFLYQIRECTSQRLYALKVFKPSYRSSHITVVSEHLSQLVNVPGLALSGRICLTTTSFPELIAHFPDLEYAVLMPWAGLPSWAGLLLDHAASALYTYKDARDLSLATVNVLRRLEAYGMAHTDLAGTNVLVSVNRKQIQLLDLEGMYMPGISAPKRLSYGSPGYQHRSLGPQGQWCREGDRFAGALLLTEMLTWWDPHVRALVPEHADTLFRPEEIQVLDTPLWQAVRTVLYSIHPDLLQLFDQAWMAPSLSTCPDLTSWAIVLLSAFL